MIEEYSGNTDQMDPETDPPSDQGAGRRPALCVDLDNTLIRTDLLWEGLLQLLAANPFAMLRLPRVLLSGKAAFKAWIARQVTVDPALLPYNASVLGLVKAERETGRRIVLATAADRQCATAVADYLQLFDTVIATDQDTNRIGAAKLQAVREVCGSAGFDYVGDSRTDLPLWAEAHVAHVVAPDRRLLRQVQQVCRPHLIDVTRQSRSQVFLRLLRPHQWSKNLLLLAPLVLSHTTDVSKWLLALLAVVCFCLVASAGYLFNDLFDLPSDRRHPRKRDRPVACGKVSIPEALMVAGLLLVVGIGLSVAVLPWLPWLVIGYLAMTVSYSVWLKRKVFLDVLCLAGLYAYRVLAGGLVTETWLSHWLIAFCIFMFLSLALAKRYTELATSSRQGKRNQRRGYRAGDLDLIGQLGSTSGYLAVLVFLLYVAEGAASGYRHPQLLWLISPPLLYWISRVWFLAHRQELHEDPVVFALRDWVSYAVGLLCAVLMLLAT